MKRIGNILFMTMLSLIIIYMSVGTTVMHCLRTNTAKVIAFADECHEDYSCCEHAEKKDSEGKENVDGNCMQYQHMQLSPVSISSQHHPDFTPVLIAIPSFLSMALPRTAVWHYINKNRTWKYTPHSPPRAYLAFIQVLRI